MKTQVILQAPVTTYDAARIATQNWSDAATLTGVWLPVKGETTQADSGINVDISYQFFTKQRHGALKAGNRIVASGKALVITAVLDYGKVRQVELRDEI